MICPKCQCEAVIVSQNLVYVQNEGKLYRTLKYHCRNKKCDNFEKEIGTVKNEVPVSTE